VAAVEAHFNEWMADLGADHTFLSLIERRPLIDRHNLYLWHTGQKRFDSGKAPAQPMADLIEMRDALLHFRPEWHDERKRHARLADRLDGKFPTSPFLTVSEPFFPRRCMSHGCAAWAVRSARDFADAFAGAICVKSKFAKFDDRLKTA
jgi:hypothetical protein